MNKHLNVAAYVRESRDEHQRNISTLENQLQILKEYIASEPNWKLFDIYADDNISGTTFIRPELNRLISDVENKKINIILLKDLSRLGRNNGQTLLFLDWAEEKGIQIITTDGRYNSNTNTELAGIDTWFNERYAADISRKIRATLKMKINAGEYIGTAPYGYCKVSPGQLSPVPEEALFVQMIYDMYLSGLGYEKICNYLQKNKIPPPKTNWSPQTIQRILTSPVYIGTTIQGVSKKQSYKSKKTIRLPEAEWVITENTHPAIIEISKFNKVQEERQKRRKGTANNHGKIPIFKNLLFCGYCGEKMYSKGKGYICSTYVKYGAKHCNRNFHFTEKTIDDILPLLKEKLSSVDLNIKLHNKKMDTKKDIYENFRRKMELIYNDRLKGLIDENMYRTMAEREELIYKKMLSSFRTEEIDYNILKGKFLKESTASVSHEMLRRLLSCMVEKCIVK